MFVRAAARGQGPVLTVLVLAAALAAAAARAQAPTAPAGGGCAQHQAEFAALLGLTEAEAVAAMERMPGIRTVRVVGPGQMMTRDYRSDRATLLMRDGKVERILCG